MAPEPHWLEQRFKDLFPTRLGKPDNASGTDHEPGAALPADLDRYVAAAVRGVLSDLRAAVEGERNHLLNVSAYRLGRFVSGGGLDEGTAHAWLAHVAREIGLEAGETARTIRSGIEAGKADPFTLAGNDYREKLEIVDLVHQGDAGHQAVTELPQPLDWSTVLSDETPDVDWLIPDVIERGRLHALFAPSKSHKSLITQYLCAELARDERVMYLDFENSRADLKLRFGPRGMDRSAASLENLLYFQFPSIAALDTPSGGAQLEAMAQAYTPALVILDTTSRVVRGAENDSDTFRALYRHTLIRLKGMGIAVLRIDHAGKDVALGQRGSSAKSDDVDTVLLLVKQAEDQFSLKCTHQRSGNHPDVINLHKVLDPLRFERLDGSAVVGRPWSHERIKRELDRLGFPVDGDGSGERKAVALLKSAGVHASDRAIRDAQAARKEDHWRDIETDALTLDVPGLPGSLPGSRQNQQDHDTPVHNPVHSQREPPIRADQTPVHGSGSDIEAANRGVAREAGSPTGGPVRAPVNRAPDTDPPDRPPAPTDVDKEERLAIDALVKGGIKLRIVQ